MGAGTAGLVDQGLQRVRVVRVDGGLQRMQGALVAIAFGLVSWSYLEYTWSEAAFWPPQLAGLLFSMAGMLIGTLLPQWSRNHNGTLVAQAE